MYTTGLGLLHIFLYPGQISCGSCIPQLLEEAEIFGRKKGQDLKTQICQDSHIWRSKICPGPWTHIYIQFSIHLHSFENNAVINCIPPHYPGNSQDLVGTYLGVYRILCPRRPGTYPGFTRGDISVKRAGNLLPRVVHICQDSDQRHPGLWGGDLPGDLQEKCPRQYPGLYLGHHKVQKWIPWQVPAIPG